jgi:hypothetical protein
MRRFIVGIPRIIRAHRGNQTKENRIGRSCSAHTRDEKCAHFGHQIGNNATI